MIDNPKRPYRIKIEKFESIYWNWCCDHMEHGTWNAAFPLIGNGGTFYFENEEDLTAFRLVFPVGHVHDSSNQASS